MSTKKGGRWTWEQGPEYLEIEHSEEDEIRDLLVGHSVKKVADDRLTLDDGRELLVVPNVGGCSCSAGDYWLNALNEVDNLITNVEFEDTPPEGPDPRDSYGGNYEAGHIYRLFVFAEDRRLPLFEIEGDDGNGWYGTGYRIHVFSPSPHT